VVPGTQLKVWGVVIATLSTVTYPVPVGLEVIVMLMGAATVNAWLALAEAKCVESSAKLATTLQEPIIFGVNGYE
jgi:hypothetical protein